MKAQLKNWLFRNKNLVIINLLFSPFFGGIGGLYAQTNLVPNWSFEIYTQCPTSGSQIDYAIPWYGQNNNSTDYYNACSSTVTVPGSLNKGGYFQYAKTGVAYAGINGYNQNIPNYREYLQVQLTNSLKKDSCYYVEFFINLSNGCRWGVNNLGAYLSNTAISNTGNGAVIKVTPQIKSYKDIPIIDTANWVKIAAIYNAVGGESFITIGCFNDDAGIDTVRVDPTAFNFSYYFIDDVSITEITPSYTPTFTYRDTSVIKGDSVYIGTRTSGLKCTWYKNGNVIADSVPGLYVKPLVNSSYVVKTQMPCGGTATWDTIKVTVTPNGVNQLSVSSEQLTVWPNPVAEDILHITGNVIVGEIEMYNLLGEKVLRNKAAETIDLSGLSKGLYFLKVKHTKAEKVFKIIIQ